MFTNEKLSSIMSLSSKEELSNKTFLDDYALHFIDSIFGELPPCHGDDDHRIKLLPGSSPPKKFPYRFSYAQQKRLWHI